MQPNLYNSLNCPFISHNPSSSTTVLVHLYQTEYVVLHSVCLTAYYHFTCCLYIIVCLDVLLMYYCFFISSFRFEVFSDQLYCCNALLECILWWFCLHQQLHYPHKKQSWASHLQHNYWSGNHLSQSGWTHSWGRIHCDCDSSQQSGYKSKQSDQNDTGWYETVVLIATVNINTSVSTVPDAVWRLTSIHHCLGKWLYTYCAHGR